MGRSGICRPRSGLRRSLSDQLLRAHSAAPIHTHQLQNFRLPQWKCCHNRARPNVRGYRLVLRGPVTNPGEPDRSGVVARLYKCGGSRAIGKDSASSCRATPKPVNRPHAGPKFRPGRRKPTLRFSTVRRGRMLISANAVPRICSPAALRRDGDLFVRVVSVTEVHRSNSDIVFDSDARSEWRATSDAQGRCLAGA